MESFNLTENEIQIIRLVLKNDIEDLAREDNFFDENTDLSPKEYIDERIVLAQKFGIDFWNIVDLYCHDYFSERLKALYSGKTPKEFLETYETPSEAELAKRFMKSIIESRNSK